jgi:hypothetical protein
MKKILATLFTLVLSAAVFADEPKKDPVKFDFGLSSLLYATAFDSVKKDDAGSYSALRVRPLFTISKGSLDAVFKLNYFGFYGAESGTDQSSTSSDNATLGAPAKKGIGVMQAYLKNKVDVLPSLTLTGGLAPYAFPLVWDDNAPLFSATFGSEKQFISIYYLKIAEGDYKKKSDDSQIYIADVTLKFGDQSIRPAFFYTRSGTSSDTTIYSVTFSDRKGYMGALALNFVFGSVGIDATGVFSKGTAKDSSGNKLDYSGYACDVAPYFKITDDVKITGFTTYISGDDGKDPKKSKSFLNATVDGINVGINSWRLYILEDGGTFAFNANHYDIGNSNKYGNTNGYIAAGLAFDGTFGKLTTHLLGAYAIAAKVPSGTKKGMGTEIDANIGYGISTGTTIYTEAAFLKTGKFYETPTTKIQNARYVNVGMKYEI